MWEISAILVFMVVFCLYLTIVFYIRIFQFNLSRQTLFYAKHASQWAKYKIVVFLYVLKIQFQLAVHVLY